MKLSTRDKNLLVFVICAAIIVLAYVFGYQKINEAISKGEYRIWIKLSKDQRNFLSNKNFNISLKNNVDGNVYECLLYWD